MRTSLKVLVMALVMIRAIALARPALAGVQIGIHVGLAVPVVVAPAPGFVTVAPIVTPPVVYYVPPKPVLYWPIRHRPAWPPRHFKRSGVWVHGHWRRSSRSCAGNPLTPTIIEGLIGRSAPRCSTPVGSIQPWVAPQNATIQICLLVWDLPKSVSRPKKNSLDLPGACKVYTLPGEEVIAVQVTKRLSLCPECGACPEVEMLQHEDNTSTVQIGEGEEKIALSRSAWNNLVRYVREGALGEL